MRTFGPKVCVFICAMCLSDSTDLFCFVLGEVDFANPDAKISAIDAGAIVINYISGNGAWVKNEELERRHSTAVPIFSTVHDDRFFHSTLNLLRNLKDCSVLPAVFEKLEQSSMERANGVTTTKEYYDAMVEITRRMVLAALTPEEQILLIDKLWNRGEYAHFYIQKKLQDMESRIMEEVMARLDFLVKRTVLIVGKNDERKPKFQTP